MKKEDSETGGESFIVALIGISHTISTVPERTQALKRVRQDCIDSEPLDFNCARPIEGIEAKFWLICRG